MSQDDQSVNPKLGSNTKNIEFEVENQDGSRRLEKIDLDDTWLVAGAASGAAGPAGKTSNPPPVKDPIARASKPDSGSKS